MWWCWPCHGHIFASLEWIWLMMIQNKRIVSLFRFVFNKIYFMAVKLAQNVINIMNYRKAWGQLCCCSGYDQNVRIFFSLYFLSAFGSVGHFQLIGWSNIEITISFKLSFFSLLPNAQCSIVLRKMQTDFKAKKKNVCSALNSYEEVYGMHQYPHVHHTSNWWHKHSTNGEKKASFAQMQCAQCASHKLEKKWTNNFNLRLIKLTKIWRHVKHIHKWIEFI